MLRISVKLAIPEPSCEYEARKREDGTGASGKDYVVDDRLITTVRGFGATATGELCYRSRVSPCPVIAAKPR